MVLLTTQNEFPRPVIYAMIIPVILNIVGMMLAYKARDEEEEEDEDTDTMKSLIITCFVMISLIILLGTANLSMKLIYFTLVVLYVISSFVVYYANNSFLKNERATG
jgi:fumarate reductase subunit D